ncbi:MAG: Gx transporter family protein [Candidatus Coatesbacteria bacterium]|nr:Gx transporter family protein [Candidatus Coatesbacteria bacterium]
MGRGESSSQHVLSEGAVLQLCILTVIAVALRSAEVFIPTPVPWVRIGLANTVVVFTLLRFGPKAALLVNLSRILLASVLMGTFLSPGFWLSLASGIASTGAMIVSLRMLNRWFSCIGLSMIGAYVHVVAQFLLAYLVFVRHAAVLTLMPYFMLFSLAAGALTGVIARKMLSVASDYGLAASAQTSREATA